MRRPLRLRVPRLFVRSAVVAVVGLIAGTAVRLPAQEKPAQEQPAQEDGGAETPAPTEGSPATRLAAAAEAQRAALPDLTRAFERLSARDWEGCIPPFQSVIERLEPYPVLGGLRDQCLYNVACAHARAGRPAEAVEAFRQSVANGLRAVATPTPEGGFTLSAGLTLAHILVDADLDSVRDRDDFGAALDPLLRGGEPTIEATLVGDAVDSVRVPGLVVLLSEDRDIESGGKPWREALATTPAIVCFVEGPVRPAPAAKRWLLGDGDERFAVARIEDALALLRADGRVDTERVFIAAATPAGAAAALSAALERAEDVAGFVLGRFALHTAWHADALARVAQRRGERTPWRVTLVGTRGDAAERLRGAGAQVSVSEAPAVPAASAVRSDLAAHVGAMRAAVIEAAAAALGR